MWNSRYQTLFDKLCSVIKEDDCIKFYDKTKHLYLVTDASPVGLGTDLPQTREGTSCSKD